MSCLHGVVHSSMYVMLAWCSTQLYVEVYVMLAWCSTQLYVEVYVMLAWCSTQLLWKCMHVACLHSVVHSSMWKQLILLLFPGDYLSVIACYYQVLFEVLTTSAVCLDQSPMRIIYRGRIIGASLSEPLLDELAGAFLWYIYIFVSMGSPFGPAWAPRKRATRKRKAG